MAVTGLVYCIFMLISVQLTRYEQFTNRLLSPMFIPLLWSLSWWIPGFLTQTIIPDEMDLWDCLFYYWLQHGS